MFLFYFWMNYSIKMYISIYVSLTFSSTYVSNIMGGQCEGMMSPNLSCLLLLTS